MSSNNPFAAVIPHYDLERAWPFLKDSSDVYFVSLPLFGVILPFDAFLDLNYYLFESSYDWSTEEMIEEIRADYDIQIDESAILEIGYLCDRSAEWGDWLDWWCDRDLYDDEFPCWTDFRAGDE